LFSPKSVGDYGLGNCTTSLSLGCDCLGQIQYYDAVLNNSKGEPFEIPSAICMHEEDFSLLWKHVEYRTGHSEVRRSRRLVLSFVSTVVNYEYAFYYSFYQDGTIGYEIKLTGELSTNLLSPGEGPLPDYGVLVAEGVNAQYHQHMFCARIDPAVDDEDGGKGLVVVECEAESLPEGPNNPAGNAFVLKETALLTEAEGQRECNASTGRFWKIKNPSVTHPGSKLPVAFKLIPSNSPLLLAKPSSSIYKRGIFATKSLWVTPASDEERWPAGEYTIQSSGGEGLPAWVEKNRHVGPGSDPCIWHTFGATHFPRPEDFPVMPAEMAGFMLKPAGFFEFNPAIDLPAKKDAGSKLANGNVCCSNGH
jgi:primary-amine oxidase